MAMSKKYSQFKGKDLPHESLNYDVYKPTLLPNSSKDNELQSLLVHLELGKEKVDYILENGHKFIDKPKVLARKVDIGIAKAEMITDALRNSNRKNIDSLTDEMSKKIQECMKDNPDMLNASDIALLTDIEEELVAAYLESKPLNEGQKRTISELYKSDFSVPDIHDSLGISMEKIQDHLDNTMLVFAGREGKKVLKIIFKYTKKVPTTKLIDNIRNNDLKLQDQLVCKLRRKNEHEYQEIFHYLKKFKETENFCQINTHLTIDDIIYINESSLDVEQLSIKFNKVETVIRDVLESYKPHELEERHYKNLQLQRIENIIILFGRETKAFLAYRMIISDSIESMILRAESIKRNDPMKVFEELLPLTFYYLKCSLPFDDITRIIAKTCRITLTTHEIFHIIFQLSDPILKGRAGWNPIGKSHLLDLIFETDFERGNPRKSAFHLNSIDIQMTKNLFAKVEDRHPKEATKLAYIDCHGYSDMSVIHTICQYLDVALIHVSHFDFINHKGKIMEDIQRFDYINVCTYLSEIMREKM
ncbi:hypothetical protein LOD99_5819 [Oopsacas minuta]|uniref:Uncharacterized protein n=1 Tax=Oopsacas minuta TaxID=111878 RepID=A0AAV7JNG4_9METZ|nr:hypothetical protein LOD99_5819 [Oopsacas minuta]